MCVVVLMVHCVIDYVISLCYNYHYLWLRQNLYIFIYLFVCTFKFILSKNLKFVLLSNCWSHLKNFIGSDVPPDPESQSCFNALLTQVVTAEAYVFRFPQHEVTRNILIDLSLDGVHIYGPT